MATAATGWKCTHTTEVISENETTKKIKVTCYWQNDGWNYDINNVSAWVYCGSNSYQVKSSGTIDSTAGNYVAVSCGSYTFTINKTHSTQSVSCYAKIVSNSTYVSGTKSSTATATNYTIAAKTKYTVSYNANGGTGAPAAQTKWHGEDLTLQSGKPTRTGHTFKGWALTATGSVYYSAGATCGQNKDLTLYAVWQANTYAVTYDANGGTGAPAAQTKVYGKTLTLSTVKPTRSGYHFRGWAGLGSLDDPYQPGDSYTANEAIEFVAMWDLEYIKPRINNIEVTRCDSEGNPSDEGTYLRCKYDWETDEELTQTLFAYKTTEEQSWQLVAPPEGVGGGTSGSIDKIVGGGELSPNDTYMVQIEVRDKNGQTLVLKIVSPIKNVAYKAHPPASAGGAEMFETLFPLKMSGGFYCNELITSAGTGVNLDDFKIPGFHMSVDKAVSSYIGVPSGMNGTFTFEVLSAGAEGQVMQRIIYCSKTNPLEFVRHFYGGSWGAWLERYPVVLFGNVSGSAGTITLSESCSRFRAIDIYYVDNNGKDGGCARIINPVGKTLSLSIIEAASGATTYFRRTSYSVSTDGTQIVPNLDTAGYVRISTATPSHATGTNYIKITHVLGYHQFNM